MYHVNQTTHKAMNVEQFDLKSKYQNKQHTPKIKFQTLINLIIKSVLSLGFLT